MRFLVFITAICSSFCVTAQALPAGKYFSISSGHTMFPDSFRNIQPREYNGKIYLAAQHYNDSSVFIYVPKYFNKQHPLEFVYWFHGWNNNIDSALIQFKLLEQFYAAKKNAIFVFPEGAKNSPDSYGGKLEKSNEFKLLHADVLHFLIATKICTNKNKSTPITLAGHSGAYRVIGKIFTQNSNINFNKIILFDALYGEVESFANFVKGYHTFINIYTDSGGTKQNSLDFLKNLDTLNFKYLQIEEIKLTNIDLQQHKIIFIHSNNQHNEVITINKNFERFLKYSY